MATQRRVGRLIVNEYGDSGGSVLLALHGLTDSGRCWTDLVDRLGSSYRIVAPDALGHGASDRFTAEELASDDPIESMYAAMAQVLREVAPAGGALVVGHSMGGALAAALAAREPDLVRALVLEDPAWLDESPWGDPDEQTRQRVEDARFAATHPEAAIAQCRHENPSWPAGELPAWAQAKADVDEAFLRTGTAVGGTPWREIAAAIRPPTLVVTGDREVVLHSRVLEEIAGMGNASLELHVVPNAGHCVRRDRGDAFHAVVDPWLAAHEG
jgi:lipase